VTVILITGQNWEEALSGCPKAVAAIRVENQVYQPEL
jgi:hypothetical protein